MAGFSIALIVIGVAVLRRRTSRDAVRVSLRERHFLRAVRLSRWPSYVGPGVQKGQSLDGIPWRGPTGVPSGCEAGVRGVNRLW